MKFIDRGPYLVGFPAMQIMNLWGMFFHPANVSSLTFALEVKSCSALCVPSVGKIIPGIWIVHSWIGHSQWAQVESNKSVRNIAGTFAG